MDEYKIEKGVPIPAKAANGLSATMRKMKVGDSLLTDKMHRGLYSTAKNAGVKISVRAEGDKVRIWRVK